MTEQKELSSAEIKSLAFQGLIWLRSVCEKYKLTYYLAYGSLLGAIRHRGFIPWDDDIDIWMPREDYDRLIDVANKILSEKWFLISHEIDNRYSFPWAKVCNTDTVLQPPRFNNGFLYGVSIDIFPLDGCNGKNYSEAKEYMNSLKKEYSETFNRIKPYTGGLEGVSSIYKKYAKKTYFCLAKKVFGKPGRYLDKWDSIQRNNKWDLCDYISCALAPVSGVWPKIYFGEKIKVQFEGELFSAPKCYDEILTLFYGDYMKLPPEEKRISHHSFHAYCNISADKKTESL